MILNKLKRRKNRIMPSKIVGRGYGSGKGGHTVGRGSKGQKSRTGPRSMLGFEGGNVPLFRRLPKFRGFRNPTRVEYAPVNLSQLDKHFATGEVVSMKSLREKGLIRKNMKKVKILGNGELKKKLTFTDVKISGSASKKLKGILTPVTRAVAPKKNKKNEKKVTVKVASKATKVVKKEKAK